MSSVVILDPGGHSGHVRQRWVPTEGSHYRSDDEVESSRGAEQRSGPTRPARMRDVALARPHETTRGVNRLQRRALVRLGPGPVHAEELKPTHQVGRHHDARHPHPVRLEVREGESQEPRVLQPLGGAARHGRWPIWLRESVGRRARADSESAQPRCSGPGYDRPETPEGSPSRITFLVSRIRSSSTISPSRPMDRSTTASNSGELSVHSLWTREQLSRLR